MVGATLGLLAFILAFTFGLASADSITEDSYCLMKRTRSGRPTCVQACFRSGAKKFAASCATT